MDGVTTTVASVDLLASGLTGLFTGAQLQLTDTAFTPGPGTVPGDLPAPVFTGYAVKPVTFDDPGFDPGLGMSTANGSATYQWTGPVAGGGPNILGWGLVQPGAAGPPLIPNVVLSSGLFPNPPALAGPTDKLTLAVTVLGDGTVTVTMLP